MSEFFRLIKPLWGKKEVTQKVDGVAKKVPNPDFIREIPGPDTIGDEKLSDEFVREMNELGYNVYFFPNRPKKKPDHKFFNGKDIDVFRYVFVDMDLKDKVYTSKDAFLEALAQFPVRPTMVVDSGNGIHAYWEIESLTREAFILTQLCLIQHFKTDGSIWTPLQLMRYPGSLNTKKEDQYKQVEVLIEQSSSALYQIDDLHAHLPDLSAENQLRMERHLARLEGGDVIDLEPLLDDNELPERFRNDLENHSDLRELFEDPRKAKGDRSSADMSLANKLFTLKYQKAEALQVLLNSQKARTRPDRYQYAFNTVDKVYRDRIEFKFQSAHEMKKNGSKIKNLGSPVNGPEYWDCLYSKWRTKQVLGLVAGSGVGKTTATLQMFKDSIKNTPDRDDLCVFFSLEMTAGEIISRWDDLTEGDEDLAKRLYVIGNENEEGEPRNIGLQEVVWYCRDIETSTGKKINMIAIDHLDAISRHINTRKEPSFNLAGSARDGFGFGDMQTITKGTVCEKMKQLAKQLDVFLILQSQTTKAKDGGGDIPLSKNAAYGVSNFEWYCDYILTLWRPLKRVQDRTPLRITGWQYCKIREAHRNDGALEGVQYLLKFDHDTRSFDVPTDEDMQQANELSKEADVLRHKEDKKQSVNYHKSPLKRLKSLLSANRPKGA